MARKPEGGNLTIDDKELLEIHRCMVRSRVFDERMLEIRAGQGSVWYSSIGCEAIVAGSFWGLRDDDVIWPHYRNTGTGMLARGIPMSDVIAHYMARRSQTRRWENYGVIPRASGTEGSYIPISTGAALAMKLRGEDRVVVAGCGDGSAGLGDFHEGLNMAAVLEVPLVLVVVNNQVYMHVPIERYLHNTDIARMANSFNIPGIAVDGNDLLEVRGAVSQAVARARSGEGPTLVECKTYRMGGHVDPDSVDHGRYWPEWEKNVDKWRVRDPITILEKHLLKIDLTTPDGLAVVHEDAGREFDEAHAIAEAMPPFDEDYIAEMEKHVFSGGI